MNEQGNLLGNENFKYTGVVHAILQNESNIYVGIYVDKINRFQKYSNFTV